MSSSIAKKLTTWFVEHQRDLPWRGNSSPYEIWVLEVMAQQTKLETVLPFYQRWLERFPTLSDLATASQQDVLMLWEGLGYYSRARNFHKAAQIVTQEFGGEIPKNLAELRSLPGIGRYTAGAIASLAFGQDEPAVDGNVKRVLARVFNVQEAVDSLQGENKIWDLAAAHLPKGSAGQFNQALMDLGAVVCTPTSPKCSACPLQNECAAYDMNIQSQLPRKKSKKPVPHITIAAAVLKKKQKVLIAQRDENKLLGGLWEFPNQEFESENKIEKILQKEFNETWGVEISVGEQIGIFQHAYTHFKVTLHAFACDIKSQTGQFKQSQTLQWVEVPILETFPMGKLDRQISKALMRSEGVAV